MRKLCCFIVILTFTLPSLHAFDGPPASPEKEQQLLAVLRSDAPAADKAIACKNLAIYGSSESVADLAKLLSDPQLSSWARTALEAIPGEATDNALRAATESLEGRLLVGTINSIGVRRDANAIETLAPRLQHADVEVASAAAVALGRIGNVAAAESLRKSLATAPPNVRTAIAEACVLCAEAFAAEGKTAEAIALYDDIRKADVSTQRIVEATRGAILARGQDGIPLLVEQLQSKDRIMFRLALQTSREFPGSEVDKTLVTELNSAAPDRAALIVQAMADRPNTVVLAAVLKASEAGPKEVRLSAIDALARVGDLSCLDSLLKVALEADADLSQSARLTLAEIPGENIDAQILVLLRNAKGKSYPLLLQLVGQRRIDAVPDLLKAIDNTDKEVRSAAIISLGETVRLKSLPVLIEQMISPRFAEDGAIAKTALKAASIRMPDREACATELSAAYEKTKSVPHKISLLEILGAMGGTKALATMDAAGRSKDPMLQDMSSRLLGGWMTEDAAPVLLSLANLPSNPYSVRSLRGYIRIARQFTLTEAQREEMCQKAFDAAQQTAEKKLVLEVLQRYPTENTLKQAINAMKIAELKDDATNATLVIAQKLGGKGVDVKPLLASAGLEKVKLEIVKAEYGSGTTQKDVTDVLQKQVGDLPVITLVSASYNKSFGGDPAPGTVKQLKVTYRINGKPGESSFAEDAIIVLPMPVPKTK